MKTITSLLGAVLLASVASAQLPSQPFMIPDDGDYGAYAVQDQMAGPSDEFLAKAYENFTLTTGYHVDGIMWAGIYAEPIPENPSDTDFLIEIWGDSDGHADLDSGPVASFSIDGGKAGQSGPNLLVTGLGHTSPSTNFTPGDGPAFSYETGLETTTLPAGDYFISILANQTFDNVAPVIDPEWQWHLGDGPDDGFFAFDRLLDPEGTPEYGILLEGHDLAFELRGTAVPEPSSLGMLLLALVSWGWCRGRR